MRADTGVGPAMASGSHVCSGNWPDLLITAVVRQSAPTSRTQVAHLARGGELVDHADGERVVAGLPAPKNRMLTPISRPTSPTRFVRKALMAALELSCSSHQ